MYSDIFQNNVMKINGSRMLTMWILVKLFIRIHIKLHVQLQFLPTFFSLFSFNTFLVSLMDFANVKDALLSTKYTYTQQQDEVSLSTLHIEWLQIRGLGINYPEIAVNFSDLTKWLKTTTHLFCFDGVFFIEETFH